MNIKRTIFPTQTGGPAFRVGNTIGRVHQIPVNLFAPLTENQVSAKVVCVWLMPDRLIERDDKIIVELKYSLTN